MSRNHIATIEGKHTDLFVEFWLHPTDAEDWEVVRVESADSERDLWPTMRRFPDWERLAVNAVVAEIGRAG